jgi:hypothetical protein
LQTGQFQLSPSAGSTGFVSFGAAKSSVEMSIFLNVEQWSHSGQYATHLGILIAHPTLVHEDAHS